MSKFQRDVFIDAIYQRALDDKKIIFISADFGAPALDKFRLNLPDQFIHAGISEQNMIDMAAGLSLDDRKVFVYAMSPFISLRCLEQIKCSLALMDLPVTIVSVGPGLGYADAGPTHYANEDIACLRSIVGVDICSPSDEISTNYVANLCLDKPQLRYIRLERNSLETLYTNASENDFEKGFMAKVNNSNTCLITYGYMTHKSIIVSNELKREGINIDTCDVISMKPYHVKFLEFLKKYKNIISLEEQTLNGGFGSSILELINDNKIKVNFERIGLPDRYYFENGGREYLFDNYGLSIEDIKKNLKKIL